VIKKGGKSWLKQATKDDRMLRKRLGKDMAHIVNTGKKVVV
tara:strand:- start:919 stop:1041 length:123 start_codon:yes stop_codon:yes gene_type:complete